MADIYPVDPQFAETSRIDTTSYQQQYKASVDDPDAFWGKAAERLDWFRKPSKIKNVSYDLADFHIKWFEDGELNASVNCLDRQLDTRGDKTALLFEPDSPDAPAQHVTYRELYERTCRLGNALRNLGVRKGDRVTIYLPMIVDAAVAMLACARIGAIHSVVFGGFAPNSIADRVGDCQSKLIITADEGLRGGKKIPLKANVDAALKLPGTNTVETVLVVRHTGGAVDMQAPRDRWFHDVVDSQPTQCEPERMNAEDPLFILYTSGSTGKPKGVLHTTGGYLLYAAYTHEAVFDLREDDIYWCTADVGWVTGHSYITYGPLAAGLTQIVFEGVPTYPNAGRFWDMIARHKVTTFYTAPTAIRSLIKAAEATAEAHPRNYDLDSLRIIGTVGEPINPEAWIWYHKNIGRERCPIVDTWWQTETGGHMITPLPGATPLKPGSCTLPLPGIAAAIVDETGGDVEQGNGGFLVIKRPWPAMIRNIWGDPERFKKSYFPPELRGYYLAGDGAQRDADGYFWIMGRIDDVLNVSGHRLGTMEVESALVAHELVAEAAVVGRPDDTTGEAVVAFVVLKRNRPEGDEAKEIAKQLRDWVGREIGPIAKPKDIRFGDNLPKTRSGKIMRRLLRVVAKGEEVTQDVSTLENPAILEQLAKPQ